MKIDKNRCEFHKPRYTLEEVANIVEVSPSTLRGWAKGNEHPGSQLITVNEGKFWKAFQPHEMGIPFGGLVEAYVVATMWKNGVSLQRIRAAVRILEQNLKIKHVLASESFYAKGPALLFDACFKEIATEKDGKPAFMPEIHNYLKGIEYGTDGYARLLRLPGYEVAEIVCNPKICFGDPMFAQGAIRIEHVYDRLNAGESIPFISKDFHIPETHIRELIAKEASKTVYSLASR